MAIRFERNNRTINEIKRQASYEQAVARLAEDVAQNARDVAPVHTGAYRDSIKTEGSVVYSDDPFGHLVEFGSVNNPAYAPLRRGAEAAGLRIDEDPSS